MNIKQIFSLFRVPVLIAFELAVLLNLGACTRNRDSAAQVFRSALTDDPQTLDPAIANDVPSMTLISNIYETLYHYDYSSKTFQVVPLLAADFPKVSKDELTVTIPLRKGIYFQDSDAFPTGKGREVQAQDFIFAWKRLAHPALESQGFWIFEDRVHGISEFHQALVKASPEERKKIFESPTQGLSAPDPYTLQLKLTRPYPQLNFILSMPFTVPVAREVVNKYGDEKGMITENPIGTGPFALEKWNRGLNILLKRNPTFRHEKIGSQDVPALDQARFEIIKEEQPAWLKFLRGDLDLMSIPKDNFKQAITSQMGLTPEMESKGIRLNVEKGVRFYYLAFNLRDPVLGKNKFLRQAISSAISREEFIGIMTNNRGEKAVNILPPGIADRPGNSVLKYDYDLAKAKELLKKAGFPEGKGLAPLKLEMRGADTLSRQMGEFFAMKLGEIGIKLVVNLNTFPAYLEKTKQANYQISYGGWAMDYPDSENCFQLLYGKNQAPGPNEANFSNPEFDRYYLKMAQMRPSLERTRIIEKMDAIFQEEVPWALLYYNTDFRLSHGWLLNYRGGGEMILDGLRYYRIDTAARAKANR